MDVQKTIYSIISQQLGIEISQLNSEVHFRSLPNISSMKVLQIILEARDAVLEQVVERGRLRAVEAVEGLHEVAQHQ